MPYSLSKDKLSVLDEDGKLVKRHKTQQQAKQHLAALMANVDDADKSGARHSAKDNAMLKELATTLNRAYELVCELGGMPDEESPEEETTTEEETLKEIPVKATLSFSYIKRLHLPHAEQFQKDVAAVKSTGRDTVRGYSMLWGDENLVDVESDFFTKQSNFWDAELKGVVRPLTYDHGQDPKTANTSVIGEIKTFGDDEWGRWYEAQLNRNMAYRSFLDQLISERALGTSSDSAPQYVIRKKSANGNFWLAQWPWFASALTTTPAEPRMLREDALYWKSAGVILPTPGQVGPDGPNVESLLAQLQLENQFMEVING